MHTHQANRREGIWLEPFCRCPVFLCVCLCPIAVVMASVDSKAYFQERLEAMGLQELQEQFKAKKWLTMGNFAFATRAIPGTSGADEAFQKDVVDVLAGNN